MYDSPYKIRDFHIAGPHTNGRTGDALSYRAEIWSPECEVLATVRGKTPAECMKAARKERRTLVAQYNRQVRSGM